MTEVMYFIKMEVNDFRNDVILAEACRNDVTQFCAKVEPGKGRVHQCLRDNRQQLSAACKDEERKLNIIQSENIELRPRLKAMCKEERSVYCQSVAPGKGRVVRCLQENLDKAGFSQACRSELNRRQLQRMTDYRLDFGVASYCKTDITEVRDESILSLQADFLAAAL
jgi:Golgi apparatus protein 1